MTQNGQREIAQFSFRGPGDLHTDVHEAAGEQQISFAEFCRRALRTAVANPPAETQARLEELDDRVLALERDRERAVMAGG